MGSPREFLCLDLKLHLNIPYFFLLSLFFKCFLLQFYCAKNSKYMIVPGWLSFRFLDILAARKDPAGLMGEVLINGAPQPPNFKCLSGYVVQVSETGNGRISISVRR